MQVMFMFKQVKQLIIIGCIIIGCVFFTSNTFASFDPMNYMVNLLTAERELASLGKMYTQIQNQVQMIEFQEQNLKNLTNQHFTNANDALLKLGDVMRRGQSLAYSANDVNTEFNKYFPGYNGDKKATTNYSKDYKGLVQTNQDTMQGVMNQLNQSYNNLQQENSSIEELKQRAKAPEGEVQTAQVGNEISAEQISQLQKLKATQMAAANAQAAHYAYQAQKDAIQQQTVDAVIQNADSTYPQYTNNPNFGLLPEFN
jgi:P-type conjugative transfer protein TrbJ